MTDLTAAITACIDRVRLYNHVTFVELRGVLERHGVPSAGNGTMELSNCPNLFLWSGMSDEFYDIMAAVLRDEHIELRPTVLLTYLIDGGLLQLPIAKRPPKNGYREPHWAPVVFVWTGPRPTPEEVKREATLIAVPAHTHTKGD